jgi:hypothetical protein
MTALAQHGELRIGFGSWTARYTRIRRWMARRLTLGVVSCRTTLGKLRAPLLLNGWYERGKNSLQLPVLEVSRPGCPHQTPNTHPFRHCGHCSSMAHRLPPRPHLSLVARHGQQNRTIPRQYPTQVVAKLGANPVWPANWGLAFLVFDATQPKTAVFVATDWPWVWSSGT